jgi:hypothetical protein
LGGGFVTGADSYTQPARSETATTAIAVNTLKRLLFIYNDALLLLRDRRAVTLRRPFALRHPLPGRERSASEAWMLRSAVSFRSLKYITFSPGVRCIL